MPKDYINDYATTAAANTDVGGVNIAENQMVISAINNAVREQMSHLAGWNAEFEVGSDLTAQTALAAGTTAGFFHDVTATSNAVVSSITTAANDTSHMKLLHFKGTATLNHSASFILPTQATIVAQPSDRFLFAEKSPGTWECMMVQRDANIPDVLDEDDLTSDSAIKVASQQSIKAYVDEFLVGTEMYWSASTPPSGWLEEDGSEISLTTYVNLFNAWGTGIYGYDTGNTVTFTNASNIVNRTSHGLSENTVVVFTNSGGALPAELSANTAYYVVNPNANDYQVSATSGGSPISFTDDGTGTTTEHLSFDLPDARGYFIRGWDNTAGNDPDAASRTDRGDGTTGDNPGTNQTDELKSHSHNFSVPLQRVSGSSGGSDSGVDHITLSGTQSTGGNETRPLNTYRMVIIKF
ncbi:MAG: hypothetical protein GTN99_06995 [Candidatus Dadabacteria bacterium]|nr:hypothetical protein [Candidatus Dadabacteria bacterium]